MDLGGSLVRLLLNLPGHVTNTATVNTGVDLLKEMDLGRRAVMQADGQVKYRGRQRFTYAVTDTRIEIATGGMLDTLKIPLGLTGLLSKKMKFDLLSKHNMHAGSRKDLRYAGELVIVNKNPEHAHDVELWSEDDEYEMVFDNGSGSYKPYWPAPQLEELLHCNLPDIPGKFSIRVMRGSFGADQATLDAYCDIWHGVDDIPETEECKKSLGFVAVQPEVHKCCGYPVKSNDNGTCVWKWPQADQAEECIELPGHCCQESVVSQPGSCSAEVTCQAQVMKNLRTTEAQTGVFLDTVNAGVKKWWNGRRDECWARQWRTRMFECLSTHDVGRPSTRTEEWLQGLLRYFASDSSNQDRWQAYLDNLEKLGIKHLQLDHLQNGPTNLGSDEVVVQCMLPFINNGFPYVPFSLKLWSFLKVGVYDPSEGKIFGASLHKLTSQYRQYIFDELDYKGESYKTGYDGEEGCPTAMTIPRAVDEWGNAIAIPGHSQETSESFELNFTAEELAAVELTDRLGTLEVQCGAVIAGASSPFGSSLSGAMVTAVAGESTSQMSPTDTKDLVEQLVKKGGVQLRLRRGVDPSFCTGNICEDRTVIEGSDTWTRCGIFMSACGGYCCCPAGTEYSGSFLGNRCTNCGAILS
ncbi:unnamed protein product [Symbiodinium sp. KB8]|nr:unnamed protein product [Symbiodinium sp. KB8]